MATLPKQIWQAKYVVRQVGLNRIEPVKPLTGLFDKGRFYRFSYSESTKLTNPYVIDLLYEEPR
ncbi:MAG: hypothetical protein JWP57_2448 [Spirosoma sp.]|nr:hypothetical protein [Spirosoma sp.]